MIPIGIPLQIWFPGLSAAIEVESAESKMHRDRQTALHMERLKEQLCLKYGIFLIRILPADSMGNKPSQGEEACFCIRLEENTEENAEEALRLAFAAIRRSPEINLSRDHHAINAMMQEEILNDQDEWELWG